MAQSKHLDRRQFLRDGSLALGAASLAPHLVRATVGIAPQPKPDYSLKIQHTSLDIAPGVTIKRASPSPSTSPMRARIPTSSTGMASPSIHSTTVPWKKARP